MPQVYRRRSEFTQPRPSLESRRRSTPPSSLQPQPAITDADDSIVLSDLVRTGEASRLRRRGAMRLDHSRSTPLAAPSNPPNQFSTTSNSGPSARPILIAPPRATTPPWAGVDPPQDDDDSYTPAEWRDWSNDDSTDSTAAMPVDDIRPNSTSPPQPIAEIPFMLLCGGELKDPHAEFAEEFSSTSFHPSPLPLSAPSRRSSCARVPQNHPPKNTNGCGAVVHMRAFPQRPRGVWVGKEEATDVVVGLDASYFERSIVAKMMKSACGCIREGIGCAVCGNTLGTRYMPCQAASEGLFSGSNPAPHPPSRPSYPSGPRYWSGRPSALSHHPSSIPGSSRSNFYVYTFFSAHVSSAPAYNIYSSSRTHSTNHQRLSLPQQRERASRQSDNDARPSSPSRPSWYDYTFSAPPVPYTPPSVPPPLPPQTVPSQSQTGFQPAPIPTSFFPPLPPPPTIQSLARLPTLDVGPSQRRSAMMGATTRRNMRDEDEGMTLDADGVLIESEPNSPDKVGNEVMMWPGR